MTAWPKLADAQALPLCAPLHQQAWLRCGHHYIYQRKGSLSTWTAVFNTFQVDYICNVTLLYIRWFYNWYTCYVNIHHFEVLASGLGVKAVRQQGTAKCTCRQRMSRLKEVNLIYANACQTWTPPPRELEFKNKIIVWIIQVAWLHICVESVCQVQPGMPGPASYIPAPSNEATGSCRFIKHQWGPSWTLEPCRLATYSLHRTSMGPILNSGTPVGWQPTAFIGRQWDPPWTLEPL